jgi:hypothetical protein
VTTDTDGSEKSKERIFFVAAEEPSSYVFVLSSNPAKVFNVAKMSLRGVPQLAGRRSNLVVKIDCHALTGSQ